MASGHSTELSHKKYRERFTAPSAHVLVADDTPMNLEVFTGLLKRTEVKIDAVESGEYAVEASRNRKYDIIFLDHMMPEKDGVETLHEIREDQDNPNLHTPTVCLTANAISGAKEKYVEAGFDDYMTKPIAPVKLEELLIYYLPESKVERNVDVTEEVEEDEPELPAFVSEIEEIDSDAGIANCGSVKLYLETLKVFAGSNGKSCDEADEYIQSGDIKSATIKIHAIKSTLRVIGAGELGELFQNLENAGKSGDGEKLRERAGEALERSRSIGKRLTPLLREMPDGTDRAGIEISPSELNGIFSDIRKNLEEWETEEALERVESLKKYELPEEDRKLVEELLLATEDFDYDRMAELLSERATV